jgi:Domain of unknown function (DUF4389)
LFGSSAPSIAGSCPSTPKHHYVTRTCRDAADPSATRVAISPPAIHQESDAVSPARFHVDQAPAERNRLSVGLRYFYALPWMIVTGLYGIAAWAATVVAWFSIVLGRGYPPALYEFNAKYTRLASRTHAFFLLQTDELPRFDGEPDDSYPVRVDVDPDQGTHERLSVALRGLYLIPVFIVVWAVSLVAMGTAVVGWFSIMLGRPMTSEIQEMGAKALASITRATAYALLFTDRYPQAWDSEPVMSRPGGQPPAVPASTSPAV